MDAREGGRAASKVRSRNGGGASGMRSGRCLCLTLRASVATHSARRGGAAIADHAARRAALANRPARDPSRPSAFLAVRQRKRARVARRGERNGRMSRPSRRGRSPRPSERPARVTATPLSRRETAARAPAGSEERRSERGKARVGGRRRDATVTESGRAPRTVRSGERRQGREAQGRAMGRRARRALGDRPPVDAASRRRSGRIVRGTEAEPVAPSLRRPGARFLAALALERRLPEADACRAAVDALTATSVRQPGFASQTRGRRQGARCAHARSKARRCGRGRQVSAFFACERKRAKQPPQPTESCGTKQGSTRRRQRRRELTAKTQQRRKK
ncbi:hypothetical protein ERJ75_000915000 [Trypanosoma vivax]|nr:hypothetical protein ERJ75_000915000 [Trypanosoma vivax]